MNTPNTTLFRITAPALALCLAAGAATAQNQTDRPRQQDQPDRPRQQNQDRDAVDRNHPLWSLGEGANEEWRDDDWNQDRQQRGDMAGDATQSQTYRTAYWDGYYDGYNDDQFGYDHWNRSWERNYSSAYSDGYYDGYYDQQSSFGYDPHYYVYSVSVVPTGDQTDQAERRRGDQRRQQDQARARGDRMGGSSAQMAQADVKNIAALKLVRGDVAGISKADRADHPDHNVVRIEFKDREDVLADFGPHMTRDRLPFQEGDRVSLVGYHSKSQQGETIVVSQIAHDGKVYRLRGADKALEDRQKSDGERDGGTDRNRSGGG